MTTLNKYIALRIFLGILTAFAIITSIIVLVDFVELSRNLGSNANASMANLLFITLLNAPQLVEQTIPFVILFGVMGTLFSLNKRSEFIVMRASGLSAWRFLQPTILVTMAIGVLWTIAFNPLAVLSTQYYNVKILEFSGIDISQSRQNDIWLREGNEDGYIVIHAKSSNIEIQELYDVTFYYSELTSDNQYVFTTRYNVRSAKLLPSHYWILKEVTEHKDGKKRQHFDAISRPTTIDLATLRSQSQTQNKPPFWRIRNDIKQAKQAGFDATHLIIQFHKLVALPITLIAMSIIAAGVSLQNTRSGSTLRLIIIGGSLGFGVYFIDNIISAFGKTGALPPLLAAWAPPLIVLCLGLAYLSKIEDG